jgi:hypothetical protein
MAPAEPRLCRHCERRPAVPAEVLCERCNSTPRIRHLYRASRRDDADDTTLLYCRRNEDVLRERARQRLPLFGPAEARA